MKRKRMNPKLDKRIFTATALKTHKLNVNPPLMRGGIRL